MARWRHLSLLIVPVLVLSACAGPASDGAGPSGGKPAPSSDAGPAEGLRFRTAGWQTDFTKHAVPLNEFMSGGPPRDGIPPIDEPTFEAVSDVDWLEPAEPVIAVEIGGEARAYPIQILVWHEIVNDTLAGEPIAVTFCPLCHTAIVFSRELDGRVLDFGTTGNLRHSDLVMYDRETESWWQQAVGRALVGELTGSQLEFLPSQLISWEQFREAHPDGEVLSRDTGFPRSYGSNPYPGYDRVDDQPFLINDPGAIDTRLSPKVRVLGVFVDDEAAAYPFPDLAEERVVNDELAGTPVVVLFAPGTASGLGASTVAGGAEIGAAAAFEATVDGRTLTFEPDGDGFMRDEQTGSRWDFSGRAVSGELDGEQLVLLPADSPFWFAWVIFRPETRVWSAD